MTRKSLKVIPPLIVSDKLTRGVSETISTTPIEEIKKKLNPATKSTEKKKRVPKPLPNGATRFLLDNALPFLAINPDRAYQDYARCVVDGRGWERITDTLFPAVHRILEKIPDTVITLPRMQAEWNTPRHIGHLLFSLCGCWSMIRLALFQNAGNSVVFPPLYKEAGHTMGAGYDLLTWIREAEGMMFPHPAWYGPGHTRLNRLPFPPDSRPETEADRFSLWVSGFRGALVSIIAESFSAWGGETSNGAYYIGLCGNCLKVFAKDNPKKTWCSNTCRYADGKRKERERQRLQI